MASRKTSAPSPLAALVAKRLLALRQSCHLSPEDTAARMGVSLRAYRKLESGRGVRVSTLTLQQIAKAFGIEAYEIISPQFRIPGGGA